VWVEASEWGDLKEIRRGEWSYSLSKRLREDEEGNGSPSHEDCAQWSQKKEDVPPQEASSDETNQKERYHPVT